VARLVTTQAVARGRLTDWTWKPGT